MLFTSDSQDMAMVQQVSKSSPCHLQTHSAAFGFLLASNAMHPCSQPEHLFVPGWQTDIDTWCRPVCEAEVCKAAWHHFWGSTPPDLHLQGMHHLQVRSSAHQTGSTAQSQTCPRHCACTGAACQRPGPCLCRTSRPQRPRSGSPDPDRPRCRRRRGSARSPHRDSAASAPRSLCLHTKACVWTGRNADLQASLLKLQRTWLISVK